MDFQLSKQPAYGTWTILVRAWVNTYEIIYMKRYVILEEQTCRFIDFNQL